MAVVLLCICKNWIPSHKDKMGIQAAKMMFLWNGKLKIALYLINLGKRL